MLWKTHEPQRRCRSARTRRQIHHMLDRWWQAPEGSGVRLQIEVVLRAIGSCPRCRATLAESMIVRGARRALAEMAACDSRPKSSYAGTQGFEGGGVTDILP